MKLTGKCPIFSGLCTCQSLILPVLGSVVLVLGLDDKTPTGIVVGLAFTPPLELHLEALEVSFILDHLHKTLK